MVDQKDTASGLAESGDILCIATKRGDEFVDPRERGALVLDRQVEWSASRY